MLMLADELMYELMYVNVVLMRTGDVLVELKQPCELMLVDDAYGSE